MTRVFVVEETQKNVDIARLHGTLVYIFENGDKRPSIWETDEFLADVADRLEEMEFCEDDYFLCVGSTVPLLAIMTLLSNLYPVFKVLFWHSVVQEYVPRTFNQGHYCDT